MRERGVYYFRDAARYGAQYAEVSRANGPCPEEDNR